MKIIRIETIDGPNVYHHEPVISMRLDLGELTDVESCDQEGFVEELIALLPGLADHHCAKGRPGGFVERLNSGTYFGHVVEHVAIELETLAGVQANFGKTVYAGRAGLYDVVIRFRHEPASRFALEQAVGLVADLLAGRRADPSAIAREVAERARRAALGPSTAAIVQAATERGIPVRRLDEASLIQLGHGIHRTFIQAALTGKTSSIAVDIACDKALTKKLLEEASIPVPFGLVVRSVEEAREALASIGGLAAVKPLDGNQGRGVSLDVDSGRLAAAFAAAREISAEVIVEEQFVGRDYRLLVVGGALVAASERRVATVKGDGELTIAELVEELNRDPRRGDGHEKPLTRVVLDALSLAHLKAQGRTLEDVPGLGELVTLRASANLSTGGEAIDVTAEVHPATARLCIRAARAVGLDICGIDLIARDISEPLGPGQGVIEVNAAPGLRMHLHPSEGEERTVGQAVIDYLFPRGSDGRIPIIAVTGTNGKTTTTRLIGHVLRRTTLGAVGMTTTDGIWIGDDCVFEGDTTGPRSARTVLSDPSVAMAVLETARGGIRRQGLGFDWCDVAVMTNIDYDHIGQDGIEDIDDLVFIKSLIAERVREGGTLVLNADDDRLARLATAPRVARVAKSIVFTSLDPHSSRVRQHRLHGGRAYFRSGDWLIEARGDRDQRVARLADLPVTLGGQVDFQIANVMAAFAACRAAGLPAEAISAALAEFDTARQNPGRANVFRVERGYVVVDYGHNAASFRAAADLARLLGSYVTAIVGVPGDRADHLIAAAGHAAASHFDRVIIKEDRDLRGRRRGEVARLLVDGARTARSAGKPIAVELDEAKALAEALSVMDDGETIVIFYEQLRAVLAVLEQAGAVSVAESLACSVTSNWPSVVEVNGSARPNLAAVDSF